MKDKMQEKISPVQIIRDKMYSLGWKPAELSRRSGVSETDISRFLNKGVNIRGPKVYKLMEALGLTEEHKHKPPEPEHPPPVARDDLLIRSLMATIDQLASRIGDLKDGIKEHQDRMNAQGDVLKAIHGQLGSLEGTVHDLQSRMNDAGDSGDLSRLKRRSGNG